MISIDEIEKQMDEKEFNFILHKLDDVIVGVSNKKNYETLDRAIKTKNILELHVFNKTKEIFYTRDSNELVCYEPILHKNDGDVIERRYILEKKFRTDDYNVIVTKEYINYDEETSLAFIEKVGLYDLVKEEMINE